MDFYKTLGLSRNATSDDIKKAHKKLVIKWHPDAYRGDDPEGATKKFKEVQSAYEVLSDPVKKAQYDSRGYVERRSRPSPPPKKPKKPDPPKKPKTKEDFEANSEDGLNYTYIERKGMGRSVQVQVKLTPQLKSGGSHLVKVRKRPECTRCMGDGEAIVICPTCRGQKPNVTWCQKCEGGGGIYQKCPVCKGEGVSPNYVYESVKVVVPVNCPSGHMVRVMGEGESGRARELPGNVQVVFI